MTKGSYLEVEFLHYNFTEWFIIPQGDNPITDINNTNNIYQKT